MQPREEKSLHRPERCPDRRLARWLRDGVFDGPTQLPTGRKAPQYFTLAGRHRATPMSEPDDTNAAISAGVAQALERLFGSSDADARFFDAIRQGTRDAVWLIAANAPTPTPPAGHAD